MDDLARIRDAVARRLRETGETPFAVFDFDNTCIVNDVCEATFAYLCGHELLRDRALLGKENPSSDYHERVFSTYYSLLKNGRLKAAYVLIARMFSGFTPGEVEALTLAAITEEGRRIGSKVLYGFHIERGLALRREVLAIADFLKSKGVSVWVISATPEPAVRAAMQHFGIEAGLIGMRSVVQSGVFTSVLEEPLSMFEGKVACVQKYIDSEHAPLLAVGDSMSDLPMLETAEIKVVVDRTNELSKVGSERGWFVI
ncbi:HAD-IB family phosphatase [Candidatus Kaiserbacteria bacterium]|nr:HAD-IB family phosphatase [Candidatus Kaiserbacteria bacterium]